MKAFSTCDQICERGLIHASDFATLMSHNFVYDYAITLKFSPTSSYDRKVFSQNFKAIAQLQAELHLLQVEKLDKIPFRKSSRIIVIVQTKQ